MMPPAWYCPLSTVLLTLQACSSVSHCHLHMRSIISSLSRFLVNISCWVISRMSFCMRQQMCKLKAHVFIALSLTVMPIRPRGPLPYRIKFVLSSDIMFVHVPFQAPAIWRVTCSSLRNYLHISFGIASDDRW